MLNDEDRLKIPTQIIERLTQIASDVLNGHHQEHLIPETDPSIIHAIEDARKWIEQGLREVDDGRITSSEAAAKFISESNAMYDNFTAMASPKLNVFNLPHTSGELTRKRSAFASLYAYHVGRYAAKVLTSYFPQVSTPPPSTDDQPKSIPDDLNQKERYLYYLLSAPPKLEGMNRYRWVAKQVPKKDGDPINSHKRQTEPE